MDYDVDDVKAALLILSLGGFLLGVFFTLPFILWL